MPQRIANSIQSNFTAGLKTEFTGLNFPENAVTETDNCIYSITGDVTRRKGFDFELNYLTSVVDRTAKAITTYKWDNVGGDGETQIVVVQVGSILYFYRSSAATAALPLSTTRLSSSIDLNSFLVSGNSSTTMEETECQFSDGNGYLFVYHPDCEPFYCSYDAATLTIQGTTLTLQIRDFTGIFEAGVDVNFRPLTLGTYHQYNLLNQGWSSKTPWTSASSTFNTVSSGPHTFAVASGLSINGGDPAEIRADGAGIVMQGTVTSYSTTVLTINVTTVNEAVAGNSYSSWTISATDSGLIGTWVDQIGNVPSNSDVWWRYKDTSGNFNPTSTIGNVTLGTGPAPKGHFIINAFDQQRALVSGVDGITDLSTQVRPRTGTWFQGRVWYAGVDDSVVASGSNQYTTWTENIYFSQVVVTADQMSKCYQTNDPTSEYLFDLLPTDGGVITIQGSGSIYKLFPIQNGMLVFAANGIWFITGSQGIGFSADDYTITKISSVQTISSNSFVNYQGYPIFWNAEGIYMVRPQPQGSGLTVDQISLHTIATFYNEIPQRSKKYVKGAYDPISNVIQWVYKSTEETDVTSRYEMDSVLCYNTITQAFYTYSLEGPPHVHSITYVTSPGGSGAPAPTFKYISSSLTGSVYNLTFSEEYDTTYTDWTRANGTGINYVSHFVTGYELHGQGLRRFQPAYVFVFTRNEQYNGYQLQAIWDYANDNSSGRYSTIQRVENNLSNFGMLYRKHKLRGHGLSLQMKFTSIDGLPFDIMGWTMQETQNAQV